jgi:hypothetical protein
MDPDPDPDVDLDLAIFVIDLQEANKKTNFFIKFFCLLLFEGTFTSFLNNKKSKRSHKSVEILLFLLDDRRIRIRIRNTDSNAKLYRILGAGAAPPGVPVHPGVDEEAGEGGEGGAGQAAGGAEAARGRPLSCGHCLVGSVQFDSSPVFRY